MLLALLVPLLLQAQESAVDSRTFKVRFVLTVGRTKISEKILWVTNDDGKTWKKPQDLGVKTEWLEPEGKTFFCRVTVPSDGVWGFAGQFHSEISYQSEAPKPGEKPAENFVQVRVDTKGVGGLSWLAPKGGEQWEGGSSVQLKWTTTRGEWKERSGALYYSIDNGAWTMITKGVEPAEFYFWSVPNVATSNLRLRVTALSKGGVEAEAMPPAAIAVKVVERPNIAQARRYADRARVLAAQSRFAESSREYERALAAWPEYPEALNDLGWLYAEQKQPAKGLEHFLRAKKASPSSPHPYLNAASMEARLGLNEDAMKDVADAVELGVDVDRKLALRAGDLLWNLGVLFALAGESAQTDRACELILSIRLADKSVRAKAAEHLKSKGR